MKVFAHLFQKVAGTGSARKTAFLFASFFFAPLSAKEKAAMEHCESERRNIMTIKITNRPTCAKEICVSVFKKLILINAVAIITALALGLWFLLDGAEGENDFLGIVFLSAAVLLIPMSILKMRGLIRQFAYSMSQTCSQTPIQYLTFDERIISERFVDDEIVGKTAMEYSTIRKAWETKNLILIHTRGGQILVLPKCDLTEAEQADVKRLLQTVGVPCRFKKS